MHSHFRARKPLLICDLVTQICRAKSFSTSWPSRNCSTLSALWWKMLRFVWNLFQLALRRTAEWHKREPPCVWNTNFLSLSHCCMKGLPCKWYKWGLFVCAEGRMLESRGVVRHPAGVYNASAFYYFYDNERGVSPLMWFQAEKPYHIRAEFQKNAIFQCISVFLFKFSWAFNTNLSFEV